MVPGQRRIDKILSVNKTKISIHSNKLLSSLTKYRIKIDKYNVVF